MFVWYGGAIITVGGLSQYTFVSVSRLHYVLPVLSIFAGLAVRRVIPQFRERPSRWRLYPRVILLALLIPTVFAANVYRFWYETPRHNPITIEGLALELALSPACNDASRKPPVISAANPIPNLLPAVKALRRGNRAPVLVAEKDLPTASAYVDSPCVILAEPKPEIVRQLLPPILAHFPGVIPRTYSGPTGTWKVTYVSKEPLASDDGRQLLTTDLDYEKTWRWWLFVLPVAVATLLFGTIALRELSTTSASRVRP